MLFYTIYINYNQKLLAEVRKLAIFQNKLKRLALKEDFKVVLEKIKKYIQYRYIQVLKQKDLL